MSQVTDKAQSDPWGTLYDSLSSTSPPSTDGEIAAIAAVMVIGGATPEMVGAVIAIAALVEGISWLTNKLGGGGPCDSPPIDPNDVRWLKFNSFSVFSWPDGVPSGPWHDPPPGSFEAWALPVMAMNWEFSWNCRAYLDWRELLSRLIDAWNVSHDPGTPSQTHTSGYQLPDVYGGGNFNRAPWPWGNKIMSGFSSRDSAYTEASALIPSWQYPTGDPFLAPGTTGWSVQIASADHDLIINRGALKPPWHIVLPPGTIQKQAPTSTAAKVATGAAVVGGAATLGVLVYAWAKGRAVSAVLEQLWKGVKKAAHTK